MLYPAYVHQDGAGALGVTVPDFPGCFSSAARWGDLKRNVQEAIEVHCESEDGPIPAPSNLMDLLEDPDYRDGHWVMIDIDVAALRQLDRGAEELLESQGERIVLKAQAVFDRYDDDEIEQWNVEDRLDSDERQRIIEALTRPDSDRKIDWPR